MGLSPAHAQPGNAPLAVLGLETSDGAPATVANTITDALRQRVSAAKGFKLVPGKDLMEVKLIFSCPDEAPSCMAQAAKSLGAEKLIFGSVKRAADGYLVTLKMLDVAKARVDAWVAEQIARTQATAPGVRGPVQKWFATLTGAGSSGSIRITADVVGASVLLDGLPVGVTTEDPLELGSIPTGRHEIVISKPGYEPMRKDVNVVGGDTVNISAALGESTPPPMANDLPGLGGEAPAAAPDSDDRSGLKIATWATLGAGALALALGAKFGLDVLGYDEDLDPFRRFPCEDGTKRCSETGEELDPLTNEDRARVEQIQSDADSAETLQYVGYGVGAVLVGTGVYLFYRAYVEDGPGDEPEGQSLSRRLQIAPTVNHCGGGLQARFTF